MPWLLKAIVLMGALHLGFSGTQMSVDYYGGDRAVNQLVDRTPFGTFIDSEMVVDSDGAEITNPGGFLGFIDSVGDMARGLATFEYDWIDLISESSFWYNLVLIQRIFTGLAILAIWLYLIKMLLDSGLLNSTTGLLVVFLGVALPSVAGAAAFL